MPATEDWFSNFECTESFYIKGYNSAGDETRQYHVLDE
jgi:hypothetical protein